MRRSMLAAAAACLSLCLAVPAGAESPLADLIQAGRRDAAIDLLEQGADVNAAQGDGTTPLHWAAYRLDLELTRVLLERGAEPNAKNLFGAAPLAEAVRAANVPLARLLLEAGADPSSPNDDGETALMLAATTGSLELAKLLLEHGADVNARETWRRHTAP